MFTSCEIIKSKYLENGIAKVPYNNKVFKRKNRNLSSEIDANFYIKKLIIIWLIKIIKSYEILEKM